MKVLFAVSSESISEAIVKKYQREYKEILSYKNVYYFNAILKEIQKDKSYDRIVISEDLESFSNNNYDAIDKFIFEKLDDISDEAQDIDGNETSIILICTDRRTKGSSFLVKIFGIGIYNALLGSERSMEQVCKLINKPRVKKEAKMYYKIDAEDVNYSNKSGEEVSELEIQNILIHFKKLGRNTDKFADSFNNIASQYTDEQLKIIINCLPDNVKYVLEDDCKKYQELMDTNGMTRKVNRDAMKIKETQKQTGIKIGIIENKMNQNKMTGPIVIPSSVRTSKNKGPAPVRPMGNNIEIPNTERKESIKEKKIVKRVEQSSDGDATRKTKNPENKAKLEARRKKLLNENAKKVVKKEKATSINDIVSNVNTDENIDKKVKKENVAKKVASKEKVDSINKNGDKESSKKVNKVATPENKAKKEVSIEKSAEPKKGRGRPKKVPSKKIDKKEKILQDEEDYEDDIMLPGMSDDFEEEDELILPGMNDDFEEDDEGTLPGLDDDFEEEDDEGTLPGLDDDFEEDDDEGTLPGLDDDFEEEDDEGTLPGLDDDFEEDDEETLPGLDDDFEEDDEETLPGLDDDFEEDDEETLPGLDDDFEEDDEETLPGLDDDFEEDDEETLPGLDDDFEEDDDEALPGTDDDFEEDDEEEYTDEVALPGLDELDDFEEVDNDDAFDTDDDSIDEILPDMDEDDDRLLSDFEEDDDDMSPNINTTIEPNKSNPNQQTSEVESIKPKVDYSMSSLNSLLTKDKKIVTFIGTTKNGTSFLINNLAALFSSIGINTAILDMTKNKNSYYIYTNNEEELRNIAYNSIYKLQNGGIAEGIRVNNNLSVYTALPNDGKDYSNAEPILSTLVQNHSLILIDCDFDTDPSYFASCQEIYLVQSMDILTIQPLTAFLRNLKSLGVLEPEKVRVVINKELKVKSLTTKAIIGGMSFYNDPSMSFMTELFNKDMVKACSIPFEENAYSKYLDAMVNCNVSINGYSKQFMSKLRNLGDMVYPLVSKSTYGKATPQVNYGKSTFSNNMNNTLNQMKKKY